MSTLNKQKKKILNCVLKFLHFASLSFLVKVCECSCLKHQQYKQEKRTAADPFFHTVMLSHDFHIKDACSIMEAILFLSCSPSHSLCRS